MLYFDKIQSSVLDDNPDDEVRQLREAALQSVRADPGLHQLVPYFVNFIANQVTHRLDDLFVLRQMMELTDALIDNDNLFLDPYASPLSAPVLTCLMSRKLGSEDAGAVDAAVAIKEQYDLREFSANILGKIAHNYSKSNTRLRPKLTRTCLKYFLDPSKPCAVLFGAVSGLAAAGGPMSVKVLLMPNLKSFDTMILAQLRERGVPPAELEYLMGAIVRAVQTVDKADFEMLNAGGINGGGESSSTSSSATAAELEEFLGPNIGRAVWNLGSSRLNRQVLDAKAFKDD